MKVELRADGVIVITVENGLESYALNKWAEQNDTPDRASENMLFNWQIPEDPTG